MARPTDPKGRDVPSAAEIMRRTADYVESHPIDYRSLADGPLGDACTRAELEALADDRELVDGTIAAIRATADVAAAVAVEETR